MTLLDRTESDLSFCSSQAGQALASHTLHAIAEALRARNQEVAITASTGDMHDRD